MQATTVTLSMPSGGARGPVSSVTPPLGALLHSWSLITIGVGRASRFWDRILAVCRQIQPASKSHPAAPALLPDLWGRGASSCPRRALASELWAEALAQHLEIHLWRPAVVLV